LRSILSNILTETILSWARTRPERVISGVIQISQANRQ
jgi:hypothetical protein